MEDEEDIRSHASPTGSGESDPSSSPAAGRITVTVASAGPPSYSLTPPSKDPDALALALLPMQSSGGGGGGGGSSNGRSGGGGGREDCWSEKATAVLIDAWGERYLELSRGNLKQKHWKEVAEIVSSREDYGKTPKTDIQCKNRIDTVKKKYKQEKARIANGGGRSRWVFFDKLDRLIGSTAKIPAVSPGTTRGGSPGAGTGGGLHKIPMGIPMNNRSNLYQQQAKAVTTPPFNNNLDRLIGATARVSAASFGGSVGGGGGGSVNVPMGIPMSNRSIPFGQQGVRMLPQQQQQQGSGMMVKRCSESKRWRFKKRDISDSDSESEPAMSDDSGDSLPPPPLSKRLKTEESKKQEVGGGDGGGNKWRELTRAIMRFGEAYEQTENAKLQQVVEMEKERMKFFKELELQRMQFFVKTQVEISQLKQHGRRIGNNSCKNKNNKNINAIVYKNDMGN